MADFFLKSKFSLLHKMRKNLIIGSLLMFLAITMTNFYVQSDLSEKTYVGRIQEINDSSIEQVASLYEINIKHVRDIAYNTVVFDSNFSALMDNIPSETATAKMEIIGSLDNIVVLNGYIHSVYLYVPEYAIVYSTYRPLGAISNISDFPDRMVFEPAFPSKQIIPHVITEGNSKTSLISYIISAPLHSKPSRAILSVNIDAEKLYDDCIKKAKIFIDSRCYAHDAEHSIVVACDADMGAIVPNAAQPDISGQGLFSPVRRTFVSRHHSQFLEWDFVLETFVGEQNPDIGYYSIFSAVEIGRASCRERV